MPDIGCFGYHVGYLIGVKSVTYLSIRPHPIWGPFGSHINHPVGEISVKLLCLVLGEGR